MPSDEIFISVDVEASGPSPSTGSLIAIGACVVDDPSVAFYVELRPLPGRPWHEDAAAIHGLSRRRLESAGRAPADAMKEFAAWLETAAAGRRPVFVGFNATFDWMWVADYFHHFLGRNPFGISGLDIKAYYMARYGVRRWSETGRVQVARRLGLSEDHSHNALDDAREQALLFRRLGENAT